MIKSAKVLLKTQKLFLYNPWSIYNPQNPSFIKVNLHEVSANYFKNFVKAGYNVLEPTYTVDVVTENNDILNVKLSELFSSEKEAKKYFKSLDNRFN